MSKMIRKDILEKDKWRLEDIFASDEAWEAKYSETFAKRNNFQKFLGKLNTADTILECFREQSVISMAIENLCTYAKMRLDEDTTNAKYAEMESKANMLAVEISSNSAFITPEILKLSEEKLLKLANEKAFSNYDYMLKKMAKDKVHILCESEEKLLSEVGAFSGEFKKAFGMFDNAEIKFKPVKDEEGKKIEMSHGVYSLLMQSNDKLVRKAAFKSMFTAFCDYNKTISALYIGNVKKDNFYSKARGFGSALERSLVSENVDIAVYDSLISAVGDNIDCLHKYMEFRKKVLGYDKLEMCDLHFSLVKDANIAIEYDEAYSLVYKALSVLGKEYLALLEKAKKERWIDVYETKNKRSGAYSWGTFSSHPYVLLNYQKTTHDIFTIAHEMGHALHSYFSDKTQVYEKAGYEIFVAEVASTVNEVLMLKHLIATSTGQTKKFLLCYYLDMFRTTLFRQTQFAEFEAVAHRIDFEKSPLTAEILNKEYLKITKKYYGKAVSYDKLIQYEWSRIPHFYNSFYVYKYATGITAAVVIAKRILGEGETALNDYKKFLSAGGSSDPVTILSYAGVDLRDSSSFRMAFDEFRQTLAELESLML